jgi:hypothetical protein
MELFSKTELGAVIKDVKKLNMEQIFRRVMEQKTMQEFVFEIIRIEQLFERGIDSQGRSLGEYSPYSIEIKRSKGQRYDHITLKDTGAFYESFTMYIYKNYFEIDADPIKKDTNGEETNLFDEYGIDILGITQENMEKVRQRIKDEYNREIRRVLFGY